MYVQYQRTLKLHVFRFFLLVFRVVFIYSVCAELNSVPVVGLGVKVLLSVWQLAPSYSHMIRVARNWT
jgi:hypothetical protein